MVDREARQQAAHAVRRFLDCETTNDVYESEYPLHWSQDLAIRAIYELSWSWFDDFNAHKLEGKYELPVEMRMIGERCALFLGSGHEYDWKEFKFISTGIFSRSELITLGLTDHQVGINESLAAYLDEPQGDATVWPFFRASDHNWLCFPQRMNDNQLQKNMKNTHNHARPITAEQIAKLADKGQDVSRFFTGSGRMMQPAVSAS